MQDDKLVGSPASDLWAPLRATIEEFAAEGYTRVRVLLPAMSRDRPMSWLPKISMVLTIAQLSERLRCAECGGPCTRSSRG